MTSTLGSLAVHIEWILEKPAIPGWEDIRQNTTVHTFYYIHSGKGVFYCEDEQYEVEGNTFVYLWPGLKLYMKSTEAQPLHMTMLLFDCASLIKSEEGWLPPKSEERLNLPFLTLLRHDQAVAISGMFHHLEREWVPGDYLQEAKTKSGWYRLMAEIHEVIRDHEVRGNEKGIMEAVRWFKGMLDENFASDTKITKLAQQSGFSPVYLRRSFSARYGSSPKEYLENLRNEHALLRLKHTLDLISQIALECGHSDVYQFSKMFKKRNGISPTDYRKRNNLNI